MGENAAAGALEEVKKNSEREKEQAKRSGAREDDRPSFRTGEGTIEGGLHALSKPQQEEEFRRAVDVAVSEALRTVPLVRVEQGSVAGTGVGGSGIPDTALQQIAREFTHSLVTAMNAELAAQLGPEGNGPLGTTIANGTTRAAAAAVQGAVGVVGCEGLSPAECIDRRARTAGRSASRGAAEGLLVGGPWLWLLPAFAAGILLGVLVTRRRARPARAI